MNESHKLIVCCLGIFVCYFYYGILQEKITRIPYGEAKEKFVFQQTLVFVQCCVSTLFAYVYMKFISKQKNISNDDTPLYMYLWCAGSYLGAMLASNMALQYINYPTQVLGKSCKPIPVMILGVLVARKRYPLVKYMCVLLIVTGVALFMYKDKKDKANGAKSYGFGEVLLLISLTLDGLTGASQDKMRAEYKTQSHPMMLNVNRWSVVILGLAIVCTGEIFSFLAFCGRYPYVIWNMVIFSATSALGQNFIFVTVANFGPLTCSVVTTTRKFFTIMFSVLFFGNAINNRQWMAVGLVFTGLGLDATYGKVQYRALLSRLRCDKRNTEISVSV